MQNSLISTMSKLKTVLDQEGITPTELSKASGVNTTTIHNLCKGIAIIVKGKVVSTKPTTKTKLVNAINKLADTDKYMVENVFPKA